MRFTPFTPFHLIPQLRGPLADGDFVRPATNGAHLFLRWSPKEKSWSWTPDASKEEWFPVTTTAIDGESNFHDFHVDRNMIEIIDYLNRTRAEPPVNEESGNLDQFVKDLSDGNLSPRKQLDGTVPGIQPTNTVRDEQSANLTLDETRVQPNEALVVRDCRDSTFTITARIVKLVIDACTNCTFVVTGKMLSSITDVYKSSGVTLTTYVPIKTLQIDNTSHVKLLFGRIDYFHSVVWTASNDIELNVHSADGNLTMQLGVDVIHKKHPEAVIQDDTDQFITRIVDGRLLTEKVIRLANGFPSTQREKDAWDARQERNMQAFMNSAGNSIVTNLLLNKT